MTVPYFLAFYYTISGQLYSVAWDKWQANDLHATHILRRDFRRDSDRAIYAYEDYVPDGGTGWVKGATTDPRQHCRWTDYLGDTPYGDYDLYVTNSGRDYTKHGPTERRRYLDGFGVEGLQTVAGAEGENDPPADEISDLHGDLIESTMLTTDANGAVVHTLTYTAFGEPISLGGVGVPPADFETRYQYAGGWQYESNSLLLNGPNTTLAPISLSHVGARWYQPGIGRFVQRDPIGLRGGSNCYAYCSASPTERIDPSGLDPFGLGRDDGVRRCPLCGLPWGGPDGCPGHFTAPSPLPPPPTKKLPSGRVTPPGGTPGWAKGLGTIAGQAAIVIVCPATVPGVIGNALAGTALCVRTRDDLRDLGYEIGWWLGGFYTP